VPLEGSLDAEAIHLAAKLAALCAEAGIMFQTHANEHLAAVERSLVARGQRPIQLLHRLGVLGPQTLLEASQRVAFGLPAGDFSGGGGWLWLDHATADGAEAIRLGGVTGTIVPGLAADYLLIDLDVPEMTPSRDLGWELVRLANRDQIVATVMAGRLRLWRGWPVDWDRRVLMRQVAAVAGPAVARASIQRIHPVSARHRDDTMRGA